MKKLHRIIIACAAVLLLVGAYVAVRILPRTVKDGNSSTESAPIMYLTNLEKETVTDIIIARNGSELVFTRKGDAWTVNYPYPVPLVQYAIEALASTVSNLTAGRLIAETPEDLSQFGLEKPSALVTVVTADGKRHGILVGDNTPSGADTYVRRQGENAVYTISSYTGDNLKRSLAEYRDKTLVEGVNFQNPAYVFIKGPKGTIEIRPKNEKEAVYEDMGWYVITKPFTIPYSADFDAVSKMFERLNIYTVEQFIDDMPVNLAKYGLDKPYGEFRARDAEGREVHLLFGAAHDSETRYVKRAKDKNVYTIMNDGLTMFEYSPYDLAGKFALIIGVKDIEAAEIRADTVVTKITITRTPAENEDDEPIETFFVNGKQVADQAFRKFYQEMIGFLADGRNTKPASGKPALTVSYTLTEAAGGKTIGVSFVPYDRDFYQIYKNGISDFLISRRSVDRFFLKWEEYMKSIESQDVLPGQ